MQGTNNNPAPGGTTPPDGNPPPGQTPPTTPPGQTPSGNTSQQKTSIDSLPGDIQEYIRSLREENRTNREQLAAIKAEQQRAEEARMQQQGQYEQLAAQRLTRISELEQYQTRYTTLAETVKKQIEAETKDWPAEVKVFHPGKDADVQAVLDWRDRSRALVEKITAQQRGGAPGNGPNPPPANAQARAQQVKEANKADLQQRRLYNI